MQLQVFIAVLLVGLGAAHVSYDGHKVFRVIPTAPQMEVLSRLQDTPGHIAWSGHLVVGSPYDILVAPPQQARFVYTMQQLGAHFELLIHNAEEVFAAERLQQELLSASKTGKAISFDRYQTHEEMNAYLDDLHDRYTSLANVETIGKTTEGRDMKLIKISKGKPGNPVVFIDAGIHAREWIAPSQALFVIYQLLENATNLYMLDNLDWHILPCLNPDGYEYARLEERMWRKTRSMKSSTSCPGVDGNRNFGHHWSEGGTSTNPCSDIFHGANAFSEPETENLRVYLANTRNIELYLTLHSYGEYFLYPWSYTTSPPSNWQELDDLASDANNAQVKAGGNSYTIGESTVLFGKTAGSSDDWAMGGANIPMAYTIELPGGGSGGFDMPPSRIESTVTPMFEAFRVFGEYLQKTKGQ